MILAAAIAALLRAYDEPPLEFNMQNLPEYIKTFIGAGVAAGAGAIILGISLWANDTVVVQGFVSVIGLAIGGMTAFRALLGLKKK